VTKEIPTCRGRGGAQANPATNVYRANRMSRAGELCLFLVLAVLAVLGWSSMVSAAMVTVVRGEASLAATTSGASANGAIVLTFGDEQVVIHDQPLGLSGAEVIHRNVPRDRLHLVRDRRAVSQRRGYDVLYSHRGFHLASVERPDELAGIKFLMVKPVTKSLVVLEKVALPAAAPDPLIEKVLDKLDLVAYQDNLAMLARDLKSRYLCSPEILTARDLIVRHFEALGLTTYVVEFSSYCWPKRCDAPRGYNVIGIKKGRVHPRRFCLVGAHYDSINENAPCGKAPGANDNASGVAGVMELARVFSQLDTDLSVVFVAFSGEEQDLLGSRALARSLVGTKPIANLRAANLKSFVMLDMISYYKRTYGIIIEGASARLKQRAAVNKLAELGTTYTDLEIEETYEYGDADHEPFLDRGMAGALLIEADWDTYWYYHTARDLMVYQNMPFAMQVLRMTAAMLATETGASLR
jgi:hypothetical protein